MSALLGDLRLLLPLVSEALEPILRKMDFDLGREPDIVARARSAVSWVRY